MRTGVSDRPLEDVDEAAGVDHEAPVLRHAVSDWLLARR